MANTLIIKRGSGEPIGASAKSLLQPFELGFDYTNGVLYINDEITNLPIGANLKNGLPLRFGGTGAISREGAFKNIVADGGSITGALLLEGEEARTGEYDTSYGIIALSNTYSYGEYNPNNVNPLGENTPPEGHLYFMLID